MYFMQNMQNSIMHKNNKGQSVWDCPYIKENMKLRFFDKKKQMDLLFCTIRLFFIKNIDKIFHYFILSNIL